jgi:hypothetical protein
MREACTPEMVAILARNAGYDFAPERCELLAPQVDWLLAQCNLLSLLGLENEEPALAFRPQTQIAVTRPGKDLLHG